MLAHRWQPTLGHCNFARRGNVGPTLVCQQRTNVGPYLSPTVWPNVVFKQFANVCPTVRQLTSNRWIYVGFTVPAYSFRPKPRPIYLVNRCLIKKQLAYTHLNRGLFITLTLGPL